MPSSKERQNIQEENRTADKKEQNGTRGRSVEQGTLGWDNKVGQLAGTTGWDKHGAGMDRLETAYQGKIKVHRGSRAICHAVFNWCA